MVLEATWSRAVKVWWALLWRNILVGIASLAVGTVVGFVLGIGVALLGAEKETVKLITQAIGFVIGVSASIIPVKMILGKSFGEFRLVMVESHWRRQAEEVTVDRNIPNVKI